MEHSQFFIKIRALFEKFPGIGPRQANRFIWTLLDFTSEEQKQLGEAILDLHKQMCRCNICMRIFPLLRPSEEDSSWQALTTCSFCVQESHRDHAHIMVVEHDNDLLNIEKTKLYSGLYHVLGGTLDPLDENNVVRERIKKLYERLSRGKTSDVPETSDVEEREIILALSPTKLGEFTSEYIKKVLEPLLRDRTPKLKITRLARGLATGVELEYADEITLRQAIDNRK